MAETLGSLIDKFTIKEIRQYHLKEMLRAKDKKFQADVIKAKISLLDGQIRAMAGEIDGFVRAAAKGKTRPRDEKLQIYHTIEDMNKIPQFADIGPAISSLAQKNLELWHLEDEARCKDAGLDRIGRIKRKIDLANQQRNDLIDKIDELFEKKISFIPGH
ncbi:MAG: DUF4254 domain-containing protein [Candidatus Omnitrophota bacterium]